MGEYQVAAIADNVTQQHKAVKKTNAEEYYRQFAINSHRLLRRRYAVKPYNDCSSFSKRKEIRNSRLAIAR